MHACSARASPAWRCSRPSSPPSRAAPASHPSPAPRPRGPGEPLLPLDLVLGPLGAAITLTFLSQVLSISVGFHMPLLLEEVGGLSPAPAGAWLSVLPVAALFCAPVAGRLADRAGARTLTVTGMALTAAGMWL